MSDNAPNPSAEQIGNMRIDPAAEPTGTQVLGVSGQKESEAFAATAKRHELEIMRQEMGKLGALFGHQRLHLPILVAWR